MKCQTKWQQFWLNFFFFSVRKYCTVWLSLRWRLWVQPAAIYADRKEVKGRSRVLSLAGKYKYVPRPRLLVVLFGCHKWCEWLLNYLKPRTCRMTKCQQWSAIHSLNWLHVRSERGTSRAEPESQSCAFLCKYVWVRVCVCMSVKESGYGGMAFYDNANLSVSKEDVDIFFSGKRAAHSLHSRWQNVPVTAIQWLKLHG